MTDGATPATRITPEDRSGDQRGRPAPRPGTRGAPLMRVRPAGLRVAVVFTWALAVLVLAGGLAGHCGELHPLRGPLLHGAGGLVASMVLAALLVVLGEGLRRGDVSARCLVIALACAVTLAGLALALLLALRVRRVTLPSVVSTFVILTVVPWIGARLSQPQTVAWFASRPDGDGVDTWDRRRTWENEARRTRGPWIAAMAVVSVVVGVLGAWSQSA